jgi:hypothetical protein
MTAEQKDHALAMDDETIPIEVEQEIDAAIDAYIAELSRAIDEHMRQRKNLDMSDATKDRKP